MVPPQVHTGYPDPNQRQYSVQSVGGSGGWSCTPYGCSRRHNVWAYSVPGWFTSWYVNECNKHSNDGTGQYSARTYPGQIPGSTTVVCEVYEVRRRG